MLEAKLIEPPSSSATCGNNAWEAAYLRFETAAQEVQKFTKRLQRMGQGQWPRDAHIVELFCGRGNGLHALTQLGFTHLEGVDLSPSLIAQYTGSAACYVSDCRQLPFGESSKDIVIIQGGLHHLLMLPDDLEQTLLETHRVLRNGGRLLIVEPWLTPFLSFAHAMCRNGVIRRLSGKVDALATMISYERQTYQQWLDQPQTVLGILEKYVEADRHWCRWGKINFVGHKKIVEG